LLNVQLGHKSMLIKYCILITCKCWQHTTACVYLHRA